MVSTKIFNCFTFTFSHLADAFIQSDLQINFLQMNYFDNNKKILQWYLKDHVTLKTGVMMLKIHLKI